MKLNLVQLGSSLRVLTETEKKAIKGGWTIGEDELKKLFDYSQIGGYSSTLAQKFNQSIIELGYTSVGESMLRSYLALAASKQITLYNIGTDKATYHVSATTGTNTRVANSLDIGAWGALADNLVNKGQEFYLAAHEMYHAFQNNFLHLANLSNTSSSTSVMVEIDANLFAGKAAKQFDSKYSEHNYYDNGAGDFVKKTYGTYAQDFRNAWNKIVNDDSGFTLLNYNTLICYFQVSGFNSHDDYNAMDNSNIVSLTNVFIDDVLYKEKGALLVPPTAQSVSGSSGSTGGTSHSSTLDSGFYYDPDNGEYSLYYSDGWQSGNSSDDSSAWQDFYNNFTMNFGSTDYYTYKTEETGASTTGTTYRPVNESPYVLEYYNSELDSWQYVSEGESPMEGYDFVYSQEPGNPYGYNQYGYDPDGFDAYGYDAEGFDRSGVDEFGFDRYGLDDNGLNWMGYDWNGYDTNGFDAEGYDRNGYDSYGFDREGYDIDGYDFYGFRREDFC